MHAQSPVPRGIRRRNAPVVTKDLTLHGNGAAGAAWCLAWTLLLLAVLLGASAARALPGPPGAALAGGLRVATTLGLPHQPARVQLAASFPLPFTGTHYIYVEDGSCPVKVDVFQVTRTSAVLLQTFTAANACQYGALGYGENEFAYATVGASRCLVVTSTSPPLGQPEGPGSVLSYQIAAGTGTISQQVSKIRDPLGGGPYAVTLSPTHRYAIVTTDDNYEYAHHARNGISAYVLGAGCTLTRASTAAGPTSPYSGPFVSSAITSNGEVVTVAPGTSSGEHPPGALDFFSFNQATGALVYQTAKWSQISGPYGIVADGALIFTGQWGGNRVQAGTVAANGSISFVPGSPAIDPTGGSGVVAWFDKTHKNFVAVEAGLGFFHAAPFAFSQQVTLTTGASPETFAQSGRVLFVAEYATQAIEACPLTRTGSSGCTVIAHLPSNGEPQGLAIS